MGPGLTPFTLAERADELPPDPDAMPEAFLVASDAGVRIHFLDWGGSREPAAPSVLLIHGLLGTAWTWSSVTRRLRARAGVVAMDLRGHGLSDPVADGYDEAHLIADVLAVGEGSGLLPPGAAADGAAGAATVVGDETTADEASGPLVIAGHGYGAIVAAWTARALSDRCAGLVLVDGGWERLADATGQEPGEWLAAIEEPPEVLHSMGAWLADRAAFDPASWDADAERAARAQVVETAAGRVKLAIQPWAVAGSVGAMWSFEPGAVLAEVRARVVALVARDDDEGSRMARLREVAARRAAAGGTAIRVATFPALGHGLPRSVPGQVAAAILDVAAR